MNKYYTFQPSYIVHPQPRKSGSGFMKAISQEDGQGGGHDVFAW
jgi:hypothetical protein